MTRELGVLARAAPGGYRRRAQAYQETDVSMRGGVCGSVWVCVRVGARTQRNKK